MMSEGADKKIIVGVSGFILAILQYGYNIFSLALIAHPDFPPAAGIISIFTGMLFVIFAFAKWSDLSKRSRDVYFVVSALFFILSASACVYSRYTMTVTLFSTKALFDQVFYIWYGAFLLFGASFTHIIGLVVLYTKIDFVGLARSWILGTESKDRTK